LISAKQVVSYIVCLLVCTKTGSYYCHLLPIPVPPVWLIYLALPHLMTCH